MESDSGWTQFWAQAAQNLERGWSWSGFERSAFFLNTGGANFVDIGTVLGADQVSDGRGLAAGDIDGDGDLDLVGTCSGTHPHVYVLRNDLDNARHFLMVDLVPADGRSAAGTQLRLTAGGTTQRRDVVLGSGFVTQHSLTQHFGLGDTESVDDLRIVWPDGEVDERSIDGVDQHIVVRQGEAEITSHPLREPNYNATRRLAPIEWDSQGSGLLRMESWGPSLRGLKLTDLEGERHTLGLAEPEEDAPYLLVNLWATWCANCRAEVPILNTAHAEAPSGLRVLGVSVDEEDLGAEVAAAASTWGVEYPVVHLTGAQRERFEKRMESMLASEGGLALPTSLLVDPTGKVLALARGEVEMENVELFLESLER